MQDGEYLSVIEENNTDDSFIYNDIMSQSYDGQEKDQIGCGKIVEPDKYVNAKYGGGWSLDRNKTLDMEGHEQSNLSCYLENKFDKSKNKYVPYSEGNCWMVSAYNVLQYLANTKWKNMPQCFLSKENKDVPYDKTNSVVYDPSKNEPNVYSKYFDSNGNNKSKLLYNTSTPTYQYKLVGGNIKFPVLYTDVRRYVDEKYKNVNGGTVSATTKIIKDIVKQYGNDIMIECNKSWNTRLEFGAIYMDKNRPLVWSTSGDTYGNHSMAVCGYRYYSKVNGWWIFKWKSYKIFYELRDGHTSSPRYYDMSGYKGKGTIALIICLGD